MCECVRAHMCTHACMRDYSYDVLSIYNTCLSLTGL